MPFPSDDQIEVINHRGRPLVVIAGPGTGKTSAVVERMIRLLEEDQSREVSFVTFTRASQRDTSERLREKFGEAILDEDASLFPRTSTLHTYAKSLVHRYAHLAELPPTFSVPIEDRGERRLIVEDTLQDLTIEAGGSLVAEALSCFRSTGSWSLDCPLPENLRAPVAARYEMLLRLYKAVDMEGVIQNACAILRQVVAELPPIFLQVDEYQDLNPSDQLLVRLAASHSQSQVVVVGDDAQSIYGFRHANLDGLRQLWQDPQWAHKSFPDSARLPAHILNAAINLIQGDGYLGSRMNPKPDNGTRIKVLQCTTSAVQIAAIAHDIRQAIDISRGSESPLSFHHFLVLCPTTSFVDIATTLLANRYGIPTHKPTRNRIPDDLWPMILLLRVLSNEDPLALRQWLPTLGFSTDEIRSMRMYALEQAAPFFDVAITRKDPRLESYINALSDLRTAASDKTLFLHLLTQFDLLPPQPTFRSMLDAIVSGEHDALPTFGRLIRAIYTSFGVLDPGDDIHLDDKVLVATLHSAKGLEAEYVYCPWMSHRFMPMHGRDPSEEKRLLYVAMTRAKRDVRFLFHEEFAPATRRRLYEGAMSPFLRSIRQHLSVVRTCAGDVR